MLVRLKSRKSSEKLVNYKGRKILIEHIGKRVTLCNGRDFFRLTVSEDMVGHYFLDFIFTKALGPNIHVKKKSKKKSKK